MYFEILELLEYEYKEFISITYIPIEYESILTWLNKINIRAECNKEQ